MSSLSSSILKLVYPLAAKVEAGNGVIECRYFEITVKMSMRSDLLRLLDGSGENPCSS
ncbi:hypothetical protein D3C76_1426650 [compost metagenome]